MQIGVPGSGSAGAPGENAPMPSTPGDTDRPTDTPGGTTAAALDVQIVTAAQSDFGPPKFVPFNVFSRT